MSTLESSQRPTNGPGEACAPSFLDEAFRAEGYTLGFPQVFAASNAHWRFAVDARGAPTCVAEDAVAFCAGCPLSWSSSRVGFVRVLNLGSVATKPGCEGQGFASLVLQEALAAAERARLQGVVLFAEGEKARLYEKVGFAPATGDTFVFLHPAASGEGAAENATRLTLAHADLVKKGYGKSRVFFDASAAELGAQPALAGRLWQSLVRLSGPEVSRLSWREFQSLVSIPNVRVRWLERAGGVEALCFLGKGVDFQNVLHGLVARSERDALFLLGESAAQSPESTVTLLVDGSRALLSRFVLSSSDAVQLMTKALPAGGLSDKAFLDLFRSRALLVRGLQSC